MNNALVVETLTNAYTLQNPYDNACIESFHAALKKDEVYTTKYVDYDCARIAISKYIEGWYNRRMIHSALGYITP